MLIVLEGLDGAGKSTQVKMLDRFFAEQGKSVEYLHFPRFDAPVFGEMIAKYLRGDFGGLQQVHPQLVALLYAEDRRDAAPMIRSWLDSGKIVILDRYVCSNIAFQCARAASDKEAAELEKWILDLEFGTFDIPKPDANLFLDVPIGFVKSKLEADRKGSDRDYLKGKQDIHESSIDFQAKVRQVYLDQCKEGLLERLDCSASDGSMLPAADIFNKIKNAI